MKLLDNKTPQVDFDNINACVIAEILNNKSELVQVNEYGDIATNDKAENYLYIICFTYVPYVESDVNELASGDLV